jgi:hypothetical protein
MKKIIGILAVAATFASSVFAADFAARAVMEGKIAGGDKDKATIWSLSEKEQKDADALVVSVNGDNAGAQFQMWYKYDASGSAPLNIRNTNIWFKPIDMLKVTVGDVSVGTYKEMIDWWKVGSGERADAHQTYTWSGYASVEGPGLSLELTPIAGLWLNAGITAKPGTDFATIGKDSFEYAAYGAAAKYTFADFPLSAAISWRDAGKGKEKIFAIGAEYGNHWSDGFYGMLNVRMRFEEVKYDAIDKSVTAPGKILQRKWDCGETLSAIVFDNYFKYAVSGLSIQLRAPVTIRMVSDMDGKVKASAFGYSDPSWMSYELYVSYPVGSLTTYLDVENDNAITFNDKFVDKVLQMNIKPGVKFNVGACSLDMGVQISLAEGAKSVSWSVPFLAALAF